MGDFEHKLINTRSIQQEGSDVLGDFDTLNFKGDVTIEETPDGTGCITIGETGQFQGKLIDFTFSTSGNSANKWLNVTNNGNVTSDKVPLVMPQDGELMALTFANEDDDEDQNFEIYVNGSLVFTWEVRNKRWAWKTDINSMITANQGDRISIFSNKFTGGTGGSTPQNPVIETFWALTSNLSNEGGGQTGV